MIYIKRFLVGLLAIFILALIVIGICLLGTLPYFKDVTLGILGLIVIIAGCYSLGKDILK